MAQIAKDSLSGAAQLALIVLRSQVSKPDLLLDYLLPDQTTPVGYNAAIEGLGRIEKPIQCRARSMGTMLLIECERLANNDSVEAQAEFAEKCAKILRDATELIWGVPIDNPVIQFVAEGDTIVVPLAEVLVFMRDYHMEFSFGVTSKSRSDLPDGVHLSGALKRAGGFEATLETQSPPPE